ncbi:deoxyuridine 5'-triphosphate nucleotidohydrolase [Aeromonas phage Akh-2]|nr:deoxyuridine 5'-triphosphate nucleotidohydrolase [Aeromonas phage Akh-2]
MSDEILVLGHTCEPLMYTVTDARLEPHIGSELAAGMDLRCNISVRKDSPWVILKPNESIAFGTGVRVAIPEGWVGLVMPRSGLGFKYEVMLANSVGVIDADYRGEIMVKLVNRGKEDMTLQPFDRVVQMVVVPHWYMKHIQKLNREDFDKLTTERGEKGFGSSGIQ